MGRYCTCHRPHTGDVAYVGAEELPVMEQVIAAFENATRRVWFPRRDYPSDPRPRLSAVEAVEHLRTVAEQLRLNV